MRFSGRLDVLRLVTIVGWAALMVSMVPAIDAIGFELGRWGVAVGPTGSIILALRKMTMPIVEVFEAGRQCGRREASVSPERPRLRVVDGD